MRKLWREALPSGIEPSAAYLSLSSGCTHSVWLDAGPHAATGYSYIGIPTDQILVDTVQDGDITIFEQLRDALAHDAAVETSVTKPGGFSLGWVGWLGYELAGITSGVPTTQAPTPDAVMMYLDWALEFDHASGEVDLLVLGTVEECAARKHEVLRLLAAQQSDSDSSVQPAGAASWRHSAQAYETLVAECLEYIRQGDAYQLCLTNQIEVETSQDPVSVYLRLRQENPTHHGGLIRYGDISLLSSSPEVFLEVDANGQVTTKPIKGTRKRGETTEEDSVLTRELLESEKERAENLMIVDLMRNDVGKIAQLGTVRVEELLNVETYQNVHQLVSTVTAILAPGLTAVDAVYACFPAGSMTGAPKVSAMTILNKLELGARGIYSGAFGYFGIDGAANLAMVIRSIVMFPGRALIGTGGGITSGSIPHAELEETRLKAAPLLRALGVDSSEYS